MAPHWLPTVGATLVAAVGCAYFWKRRHAGRCSIPQTKPGHEGYAALIGNTPLVELKSLSRLTGRTILVKCEHLNPGGTGKDRIARAILAEAEANGYLKPGGTVVEGTSGSTGIALAALCASRGYCCLIVMPDDQADEKKHLLERFGASVTQVKTAAIANPSHYVQQAKRLAQQVPGAFFANQFENLANFRAHLSTTGPEIWEQARGRVDAFVMSAGTGGTIAGVSQYLRQMNPAVKTVLADPPGSSLFHWAKHGVCWAPQQAERRVRKHRYDTIAEGIGLDRITANLGEALIDDAIRVADQVSLFLRVDPTGHFSWLLFTEAVARNQLRDLPCPGRREHGPLSHAPRGPLCRFLQRHERRGRRCLCGEASSR